MITNEIKRRLGSAFILGALTLYSLIEGKILTITYTGVSSENKQMINGIFAVLAIWVFTTLFRQVRRTQRYYLVFYTAQVPNPTSQVGIEDGEFVDELEFSEYAGSLTLSYKGFPSQEQLMDEIVESSEPKLHKDFVVITNIQELTKWDYDKFISNG